jgi:hypothetical protein
VPGMTARLARWSVELEYGIASDQTLFPLPGHPIEELPLLIVLRHEEGTDLYFHPKVPRVARLSLDDLGDTAVLDEPERVLEVLRAAHVAGPSTKVSSYFEGSWFPHTPSAVECEGVEEREGKFVVMVEGRPVSRAWTVRENAWAAELAVETDPEHQRHGLARRVASAWARSIAASGRAPFYSYRRENAASEALARSLGTDPFATSREYTG